MASRLREPFGKAGLIVAVIALVAALVGGAYAANTSGKRHHKKKNNAGLNSKQKKQVRNIAKSFQGTGPAGPQGPAGSNGNDGSNGSNGAKGDTGSQGPEGKQGPKGDTGDQGEPGPLLTSLPSGKTLTGRWGFGAQVRIVEINGEEASVNPAGSAQISFPFPLAAAPDLYWLLGGGFALVYKHESELPEVVVEEEAYEEVEEKCPGGAEEPQAAAGALCIYIGEKSEAGINFAQIENLKKADPWGAEIPLAVTGNTEYGTISGTWAVTAP